MKNKNLLHNLSALLIPSILVLILYGNVFLNPSDYFFSSEGDGVKNYYALAWFVEHNEDWVSHSGMNYPYGEEYIYTDGMVPVGWVLKALNVSGGQAIGVVNFMMLFGFVLCAFFLYKILRHYKVNVWLAILGGTAIAFMSPQVDRMGGHFSLSLAFFFPLSVWLLIKYVNDLGSWKKTIFISMNALFWFFMHPYLGMIISLFYLSVWLVYAIKNWGGFKQIKILSQVFVQSILPLVLFKLFTVITDTHLLRPDKPTGFWDHGSSLKSILLPSKGPLTFVRDYLDLSSISWEGTAYIGLGVIVFIGYFIFDTFKQRSRKIESFALKDDFQFYLIPSILVLVFSFGIPFYQLPVLADIFSPVRNFRALGRFAWPFFYIISILSLVKLSDWAKSREEFKNIYVTCFLVLVGLLFVEGIGFHKTFANRVLQNENEFKFDLLDEETKSMIDIVKTQPYKALLPLPYYHVGSERYTVQAVEDGLYNSMILSYHTGLSILSNMLPRTSLTETKNSIMVISPSYYEKEIGEKMGSGNLLLVLSKGNLKPVERSYIDQSKLIHQGDIVLKEISIDRISKQESSVVLNLDEFSKKGNLFYKSVSNSFREYFEYSDATPDFKQVKKEYTILKEFKENEISPGTYEASFWYKNIDGQRPNHAFYLEVKDKKTGAGSWDSFDTLDKATHIFSGDSLLFIRRFEVIDSKDKEFKLVLKRDQKEPTEIEILNFLIRNVNEDIYRIQGDKVSVNNHRMVDLIIAN